jgi:hypothetical protein
MSLRDLLNARMLDSIRHDSTKDSVIRNIAVLLQNTIYHENHPICKISHIDLYNVTRHQYQCCLINTDKPPSKFGFSTAGAALFSETGISASENCPSSQPHRLACVPHLVVNRGQTYQSTYSSPSATR